MNVGGLSGKNDRTNRTEQRSFRRAPIAQAIALVLAAGGAMGQAHAASAFSPAWFADKSTIQNTARTTGMVNGKPVSSFTNGQQQAQQASQQLQKSIADLGLAAQGIAAQQAAQAAARQAALSGTSNVPDGLGAGGLNVDTNSLTQTWLNAQAPTQSVDSSGHVTVDVKQTAARSILSWSSFNVGKNTTLNFDQSGGTQTNGANDWAVLNRINDPSGIPSKILGSITAQGSVYVINRNGIIFGHDSQVNVHSLVASSLDFLNTNDDIVQTPADIQASNDLFMKSVGGLAALEAGISSAGGGVAGIPNEILGLGNNVSVPTASQYQAPGNVVIKSGASISTHTNGTASDGGLVLIAGTNVSNAGQITAANGQVILAAGVGVSLRPNSGNPQVLLPELSGKITAADQDGADITPVSTLTNTNIGIVETPRGTINLLGTNVNQNGVVGATTSVSTPGSIVISTVDEYIANTPTGDAYPGTNQVTSSPLDGKDDTHRAGQLIFGDGSVTTILPDGNGETATSSPGTVFAPGSIGMTAGSVWFQNGSLIEAPGSNVTVAALTPSSALDATPPGDTAVQGRIYVDNGATIDVAGIADVQVAVADTLVTIGLVGQNELADSPLLRNSFLAGSTDVVIDSTLSGTRADGTQWVGSPVLNAQGYVDQIPRSIEQLLTNGGDITLAGNEVLSATGSMLNLDGGYVHYLGGMVKTTVLEDQYGNAVPIGQADPNDIFVGIAGQYINNHARWGVSETYQNALIGRAVYEDDFIVGGNAGSLNVFGTQAVVLDGGISAQAVAGSKQIQDNSQPSGGSFNLGAISGTGAVNLAELTQGLTSTTGEGGTVILQHKAPDLGPGFSADQPLDAAALAGLSATDPDNLLAAIVVPTDTLNEGGFSNVSVTEDKNKGKGIVVAAGSQLNVQAGGSIALNAASVPVTILGDLRAPSGTISIVAGGDIVVGNDAVLSVAGQWVNNDVGFVAGTQLGGSQYINGGSITMSTVDTAFNGVDTSGSIILQAGSLIDVSSGGEMQANGQMLMQNGLPEGMGGSLSLLTYFAPGGQKQFGDTTDGGFALPTSQPTHGRIEMDGTIRSEGFAGGGTLTLQALGFQIGGDQSQAPSWDLYLPTSFLADQGFGQYALNAMYDATIAPDAKVILTQLNLIPDFPNLQQAASGADLWAGGLTATGSVDPYYRQPTGLDITAGGYLAWQTNSNTLALPAYAGVTGAVTEEAGASIIGDAGAQIGLGSPAQVTVLGAIVAPGGSITLSGDSVLRGFALPGQESVHPYTSPSQSVWLGADAVLDVSGAVLTDPFPDLVRSGFNIFSPTTGKVLPGGSVTISDDSGYVVAQAGALINVSGTSGVFDEPQAGGGYAPQSVWSDAGSITLAAASGLMFDGTLLAQRGAAQAQGGTLNILPIQGAVNDPALPGGGSASTPGATLLLLQQSGQMVPDGLAPGDDIGSSVPTGVLEFAADRLAGSGLATLALLGNGRPDVSAGPVPIVFAGNVNLNLSNAVIVDTSQIAALRNDQAADLLNGTIDPATGNPYTLASLLQEEPAAGTSLGAPTITIDAPYVAIDGPAIGTSVNPTDMQPIIALADGTLTINAAFIDLVNQFQLNNFGNANFNSSGDIRLTSTNSIPGSSANALDAGELFTSGNLTFKAVDVYPSTGSSFILDAVGPTDPATNVQAPTTITFLANGVSNVPMSAGGTLLVDATNIVQAGTVRAPFGSLIFGIGDATDPAVIAQFNNLPLLVNTQSVLLADGSITSVSADGAIVPYGDTVDGVEWQFNPLSGQNAAPDLTAPPSKFISVNGSKVALNAGANIDLSGGGDLQAEEWVSGTGGTRDVLSQYNISFAKNPGGDAIPLNKDAGNVYAILPGAQTPVAAYDPVFAQMAQPGANGVVTDSTGVGQAALGDAVGKSVYLSNVPGLPAGYYTLLPAKYASLPGAYRVTVQSASGLIVPGEHAAAPDGTQVVAGYFGNALSGSRDALPVLFDVQSGAVWKQYSQYTLTSANTFFSNLAAKAGNVMPQLPMDGGQLVIAAVNQLSLGAGLNAAPAAGGAPAEVDIASQDIQIVGNGEAALSGYLQISADQLNQLGAGSLLIGGKRSQTDSGISIDAIANSVVVSNDAADPLTGPEIILVTKTDTSGTDAANAANGLRVDSGSVIAAKGDYPANREEPIFIGQAGGASGDGSLLMVSNGGIAVVNRANTSDPATNAGLLTVAAGATLDGGAALTLDSSGQLTFDPAASLSGTAIAVDGSEITFTDQAGADAGNLPGFVAGPQQIAQLANAQEVIFRSAGLMNFIGNADITFGNDVDLSAPLFASDGGAVTITAPVIAFTNETDAQIPSGANTNAGNGTLTVNGGEIDFGTGSKAMSGFGAATFNASSGLVGQGTGTFDFGAVPVTLSAPIYLADTGSDSTIQTTGALNLDSTSGTALNRVALGGAWSFIGGTVNDNGATIAAPAGNLSLEATAGDLTIADGSLINAAGVALPFFDMTEYAPAGAISLTADTGTVNVQAGSTLDFSGADGGGAAGSLTLSAPVQVVQLAGTIKGNAADGYQGGSFSLTTGGAVDLDNLSAELASSGVNAAISVDSKAGNLVLSAGNTIKAHVVSLTADGGAGGQDPDNGHVNILGTIDASGNAGGEIDLYGKSGVDLEGSLIATGSSSTERGGNVNIGTTAINTPNVNSTYGFEDIAAANAGTITLGSNASIDVSGGTAGGLSNGTVSFRAPIVNDGSGGVTVNLLIEPRTTGAGPLISGARSVVLEAYGIWSTTDNSTGNQHFDGIVDPAGWYGNTVAGAGQPGMVAGTWTDQKGNTLAAPTADQLADYLANDFFTPTAANTDHQGFYGYQNGDASQGPGTLMNFVEHGVQDVANKFANTGIANFAVVPGIELDNPSTSINNGDISILTNWNLGSGASQNALDFRFSGQAPVITFRAENNVKVDASLTDGFFQIANPVTGGTSIPVPPLSTYSAADLLWNEPSGYYASSGYGLSYYGPMGPGAAKNLAFAPQVISGDPQEVAEYYALYTAYVEALNEALPISALHPEDNGQTNINWVLFSLHGGFTSVPGEPAPPVVPSAATQQADPSSYLVYLQQYEAYVTTAFAVGTVNVPPAIVAPIPPAAQPDTVIGGTSINTPPPLNNTPSPVATAANPLPLLSASLTSGASSSFRVVAGANLNSANPLALQAAAIFGTTGGGNVTLDGHFGYVDLKNLTLLAPTMIRTGTGFIDVAAGNNVSLSDPLAPGVIYTAGEPAAGAPAVGDIANIVSGSELPDLLVSPSVNPDSGGDISIHAQNDITGIENVTDSSGTLTGASGTNISQFWWQWMEISANPTAVINANTGVTTDTQITRTSIDFGAFDQGVMSVGGNVTVSAGRDIRDLAVSLPTTWYLTNNNSTVNTVGGGNLSVTAGGDILSGDYFVAKGTGTITAGGRIGPDFSIANQFGQLGTVSTLFATQDGVLNVTARQGADIGGVFDPSYVDNAIARFNQYRDSQGYSSSSAINVESTTGDVDFGTLNSLGLIGGGGQSTIGTNVDLSFVLPATVDLTALTGGITVASGGALTPSATGNLSLIADQSINLASRNGILTSFGMLDIDPSSMPLPTAPNAIIPALTSASNTAHAQSALHGGDTEPARIYSLDGSIVDGILESTEAGGSGFYDDLSSIVIDKPALIQAGDDIANLIFQGQNLRESDVTRIVAGRDIYDTPLAPNSAVAPSLVLGGPGTFDVEAGRNIGPLTNEQNIFDAHAGGATLLAAGIEAVGNADNPNLPHESANINVLFGVGPGVDTADFIAAYIDPAAGVGGVPASIPALIAFMEQYDAGLGVDTGLALDKVAAQAKVGTLTAGQAWAQFQMLPSYVQQFFAEKVLFSVLTDVGNDFHDVASPFFEQYSRGYQAINTLFPAALGYTANNLEGGANGANKLVSTGNLDIRSTTIQTQQGGDVTILGPGGQALIGSTGAPPEIVSNNTVIAGPGTQGILTLEQGDINIFTDTSLLLAQSRVFTEQGGDMTIWSSNGDINAGKGAKTSADVPPPNYVCDADHYCTVDARGEVTGAGIATLQSIPGAPPGDINLLAPRGTVDAGDAGIRVSGNINIAALAVANAANIQVQGKSTGVPVIAQVDVGALTNASAAASQAATAAENVVHQQQAAVRQALPSIFTVQVLGFGNEPVDSEKAAPASQSPNVQSSTDSSYDSAGALQFVGIGRDFDPRQVADLNDKERRGLQRAR